MFHSMSTWRSENQSDPGAFSARFDPASSDLVLIGDADPCELAGVRLLEFRQTPDPVVMRKGDAGA